MSDQAEKNIMQRTSLPTSPAPLPTGIRDSRDSFEQPSFVEAVEAGSGSGQSAGGDTDGGIELGKHVEGKQKVTLYLPASLYRQLKVRSAVEMDSMSAMTEKALAFLLEHPEAVEGALGRTHQLHHCPACAHPFVVRGDEVVSIQSSSGTGWILDDDWDAPQQIPEQQDTLVTC